MITGRTWKKATCRQSAFLGGWFHGRVVSLGGDGVAATGWASAVMAPGRGTGNFYRIGALPYPSPAGQVSQTRKSHQQ